MINRNKQRGHMDVEGMRNPLVKKVKPHYHRDEKGVLVRCYHSGKNLLSDVKFWTGTIVGTIVTFPFEHYLYEKVWPFTLVTKFLGL